MGIDGKVVRSAMLGIGLMFGPVLGLTFSTEAMAQAVNFHITFAGSVDCTQPIAMTNIPISGDGTGTLNADGSASADITETALVFTSRIHFDGRIGARANAAPGGSAQVRVAGKHRLQLIWNLPNNALIVNVAVNGRSCSAVFESRLKPGKTQYTLYDGNGYHYCGKPRPAQSTCEVR